MSSDLKFLLSNIYNDNEIDNQLLRYTDLINKFTEKFGKTDYKLFSSPGRTEIGGNHTDHNHGKVIAASINLDSIAIASPLKNNEVILYSDGFEEPFKVDLTDTTPEKSEGGSTCALIRGVADGLKKHNFNTGGFNAFISSNVMIGSGLSSSASIEVLIGTIFNHFYNSGKASSEEIAKIGQYAENNFFGKPCGLMDQVACATGGIVSIDFYDPQKPVIKKLDFDFTKTGYNLVVVDSEASHADLTEDYASIPAEMKQVAKHFGKEYCAEISLNELLSGIKPLREKVNDRAILRAIHFLEENKRVDKMVEALNIKDFELFLSLINESGNSSYKYLQNIFSPINYKHQGVSLALALSDIFIKKKGKGASRVHGGGFAGTIQLFLPSDYIEDYKSFISNAFSIRSVKVLSIRNFGALCLNKIS